MKAFLALLVISATTAAFAGQAVGASNIGITIRHDKVGCHSWAIGNGAYKPTQSLTVKAGTTEEPAYQPRAGLHAPELIPLLSLTEAEFRQRFRGSPILRAKRRGFLRNVAVALGNLKSIEAVPALIRALEDEEPLVRGHAAWALGQIGSRMAIDALQCRSQTELDADVRREMEDALKILAAEAALATGG